MSNTNSEPGCGDWVDVSEVISDFNYMINQLKAAMVPLVKFQSKVPE